MPCCTPCCINIADMHHQLNNVCTGISSRYTPSNKVKPDWFWSIVFIRLCNFREIALKNHSYFSVLQRSRSILPVPKSHDRPNVEPRGWLLRNVRKLACLNSGITLVNPIARCNSGAVSAACGCAGCANSAKTGNWWEQKGRYRLRYLASIPVGATPHSTVWECWRCVCVGVGCKGCFVSAFLSRNHLVIVNVDL